MLKTGIRKYDFFRTFYWQDATLVGKYRLPQLEGTQDIPENVISFNERKKLTVNSNCWIDFFIDDVLFECFWNSPDRYLNILKKAKGIITTDYSMLPELLPGNNIWNCTRNRIMAYYLQQKGFNIIPVASWCNEDDFEWCFDGLPRNSSIAISSNGSMSTLYGKRMLLKGIEAMNQRLNPTHIIVCGRKIKELENYNNIYYYKCFSQRIKERGI